MKSARRTVPMEDAGVTEKAGDGLQKTSVIVGGMTCAACVRRVENVLKAVPGVEDAAVNLATSRATIAYSPLFAGWGAVKRAVD